MSQICFLLFLCWSAGVAATHATPTPEEVARLIQQLGDDDYERREAASKRLSSVGMRAWPALARAMSTSSDAEIRMRCARILEDRGRGIFAPLRDMSNGRGSPVRALAISRDGKRLVSADGIANLWMLPSGEKDASSLGNGGEFLTIAQSADGKRCLTSESARPGNGTFKSKDYPISIRDHRLFEGRQLVGHTDEVHSIVFLPDGKEALSAGLDRTIRLWDLDAGKEKRKFVGHTGAIRGLALSPDGKVVLSASQDRTVRSWNVETGEELSRFSGHQGDVLGVACLPDGKQAVSVGADKVARLWVIATGKEVRRFEGHTRCLSGVAVSPDGQWLLTSGGVQSLTPSGYIPAPDDHDVRLWDIASGVEVHRFTGNTSAVPVVLFAPDGKSIFSGGADNVIRRWQFGIAPAR